MTVIELKVVIEESILSIEAEEEDDHFAMQGTLNFLFLVALLARV